MPDTLDLVLNPYAAAKPPGDQVQSFREVLADFHDGHLRTPPHQRDPGAWDFGKRAEYVRRLCQSETGSHPPGSFATYQIVGNGKPSPLFLNDGLQRLTTLAELQANPAKYGMDTDGVTALLRQPITVQHRHYGAHKDAMTDFQLINFGTQLTPYELCRGTLIYMQGYDEYWEKFLDNAQGAVDASGTRLTRNGAKEQKRELMHQRQRHTLALLFRFLSKERRHCSYNDVSQKNVQHYIRSGGYVEARLRDKLLELGYDEAGRMLRIFQKFMEDETAVLEQCVHDTLGPGAALAPYTHRWLLDLAVWRRNNDVPREEHKCFVMKLLEATRGGSRWIHVNASGNDETTTFRLSELTPLPRLTEWAGMPEFCRTRRAARPKDALMPGYDHSHVEPFATNGDGPTFPEPAPLNRARGAQPVADGAGPIAAALKT